MKVGQENTSCGYQGSEFGANYEDAICGNGYLWDLDSCEEPGGPLFFGGDIPCPQCNHEKWLADLLEEMEEKGWIAAEGQGNSKSNPVVKEKLRFPDDFEAMKAAWQKGFDSN